MHGAKGYWREGWIVEIDNGTWKTGRAFSRSWQMGLCISNQVRCSGLHNVNIKVAVVGG